MEKKREQTYDTVKEEVGHSVLSLTMCVCVRIHLSVKFVWDGERKIVSTPTFVVLTLLPVLQLHPVRSGRTLHSSPSMHGCIWHHHFWATMEAGGRERGVWQIFSLEKTWVFECLFSIFMCFKTIFFQILTLSLS